VDDLARLVAERACERLLTEYARRVDFGTASTLADLFTDDGVWEAEGLVLDGREAIRAHFLKREGVVRRVSRHLITNVAVDLEGDEAARSLCYFANLRVDRPEGDLSLPVAAGLPKYTGEYHTTFRREGPDGGTWRMVHHRVEVTFLRPPTPMPPA
jgi:ketosteroid isomerase-like protein